MKMQYSNVLEGITEIFPTILHFLSGLENFSIADAEIALNDFKFCENQHNERYTLLRSVYPYFLQLPSNLGLYKRPTRKAADCDNWSKKGCTFRMAVNQIPFTHIQ
jgi:polyferredoxin